MPTTTRYSGYRRKSSLINGLTPVKPGNYGIVPSPRSSPKTVVFAPNVTPGTFTEPEPPIDEDSPLPPSPSDALFPPSLNPGSQQSRRRVPPGKRRSQGYIPRPPNAFMLFRADFVRQKHVPGSIETNHGSLSKIIGNCWRALPLDEKKTWENLAKQAKAKHQKLYPDYRFRPVHNKSKKLAREAAKVKAVMTAQEEQRCEDVAAMLLEGKKGDELAAAVRDYDEFRGMSGSPLMHAPVPTHVQSSGLFDPLHTYHPAQVPHQFEFARRPSSVPLPGIALPSLPFYVPSSHQQHPMLMQQQPTSRPESPISHFARARMQVGHRRSSSAAPVMMGGRSWDMAPGPSFYPGELQQDNEPLPDVNAGIFEQSFMGSSGFNWGASAGAPLQDAAPAMYGPTSMQQPDLALSISPLDNLDINTDPAMTSASTAVSSAFPYMTPNNPEAYFNMTEFLPTLEQTHSSGPSSAFSGSPAPSESSLPMQQHQHVHAPKPQHAVPYEAWQQPQGVEAHGQEFAIDPTFDPAAAAYVMAGHPADMYACGTDAADGYSFHHDDMSLDVPQY